MNNKPEPRMEPTEMSETPGKIVEVQSTFEGRDFLLQFFEYKHLPTHLQEVSLPFCILAESIVKTLPKNPERTMALRKLLEAKDCACRAKIAG